MSDSISVIVPASNARDTIADCVASALSGSARPLEIIVVVDYSTDDTPAIVEALSARHPEREITIEHGHSQLLWAHPHSTDLILYFAGSAVPRSVQTTLEESSFVRASPDCIDSDPA